MDYKILVSVRAQNEIEGAIDFYDLNSDVAPKFFIKAIKDAYNLLEHSPFYRIRYKNIRAIKLLRFPFSLYYIVNEEKMLVTILSCFHNKRNSRKKPNLRKS